MQSQRTGAARRGGDGALDAFSRWPVPQAKITHRRRYGVAARGLSDDLELRSPVTDGLFLDQRFNHPPCLFARIAIGHRALKEPFNRSEKVNFGLRAIAHFLAFSPSSTKGARWPQAATSSYSSPRASFRRLKDRHRT